MSIARKGNLYQGEFWEHEEPTGPWYLISLVVFTGGNWHLNGNNSQGTKFTNSDFVNEVRQSWVWQDSPVGRGDCATDSEDPSLIP